MILLETKNAMYEEMAKYINEINDHIKKAKSYLCDLEEYIWQMSESEFDSNEDSNESEDKSEINLRRFKTRMPQYANMRMRKNDYNRYMY